MESQYVIRQRKSEGKYVTSVENELTSDLVRSDRKTGGRFGLLGWIVVGLVGFAITYVLLVDVSLSSPIDPLAYTLPPPVVLNGSLAPNADFSLAAAERIYENQLLGPESIVVDNGHLYTGSYDGEILHIYRGETQVVATLGTPPCGRFEDEPTCGRPLGMRLDADGYLIVIDAYLGLFKVNPVTGDVTRLFPGDAEFEGERSMFLNDLDLGSDGVVYITDSSTRWPRRDFVVEVMEAQPHGRLLSFDPATGKKKVLARDLLFPNGVQLSRHEDYLLVTESVGARILKHHLKGPKAGQTEVFVHSLPGFPDNIRSSSRGGFWVGFNSVRHQGNWDMMGFLAERPWIRRVFSKLFTFHQLRILQYVRKPHGLVVEYDTSGRPVRSLHDLDGKVFSGVSQVTDDQGWLYLGSYDAPYIVRYNLNKMYESVSI